MKWDVEYTDEFGNWWDTLTEEQQEAISARVSLLGEHGPDLKRPAVGAIKGSKHDPQMKELRVGKGRSELRILFVFDPRRSAILLCGGDKAGKWNAWYRQAIPAADALYDTYLEELREKGLL